MNECQDAHEYYPSLSPDDFDFPMSYSFYRSLCQLHGWADPGSNEPPQEIEEGRPVIEQVSVYSSVDRVSLEHEQRIKGLESALGKHLSTPKGKGGGGGLYK